MGGKNTPIFAVVVTTICAILSAFLVFTMQRGDGAVSDANVVAEQESSAEIKAKTADKPTRVKDLPNFGVQYHGLWIHYDDKKREAVLDKIEASGATWVRLDISWAMIQPDDEPIRADSWGVQFIDEVMAAIRAHDLKVLGMFWMTPQWANKGGGEFQSPTDPDDFANAIGWAADRWGDDVDAWEVWNEPNLDSYYVGTDPKVYTELLCAAYPAVHASDKNADVVFGGLMFADSDWLDASYRAGAKGCFDIMALHSYQAPSDDPPTLINTGEVWNLEHLRAIRDTMLANDDMHQVWITEFGWSVHENEPETEPWRRGVTEDEQAEYATEFLEVIAEEFPFVTAAFWYKDVANDLSTDPHQEGFGMLDADLRPRPVYDAFRELYRVI